MTNRSTPWQLDRLLRGYLRRALLPGVVRAVGRRDTVRLLRFLTNELRFDGPNDMRTNGELLVQAAVLDHAERPLAVLDVGANVGEWSLAFIERARTTVGEDYHIHAFEPSDVTARTLQYNIASAGPARITVHTCGMSDAPGFVAFHIVGEGVGVNSIHPPRGAPVLRTERVPMDTLDGFSEQQRLSEIALVKVDTEGHDLSVIKGAHKLLERRAIAVMQFEYNHRWMSARAYLRDVFDVVPGGYRVGKVAPHGIEWYDHWDPELETYREGNYLLCREDAAGWFTAIPWWK